MKHPLISLFTLVAFLCVNPGYSDVGPSLEEQTTQVQAPAAPVQQPVQTSEALVVGAIENEADDDVDMSEPQGKQVGKASNDGTKTARRKQWQNIGLAIAAVAVAVTALILVSKNSGHSGNHSTNE